MFPALSVALYSIDTVLLIEYGGTASDGWTAIVGAIRELSSATGMVQLAVAVPLWLKEMRIFDGQDLVNTGGVLSEIMEKQVTH